MGRVVIVEPEPYFGLGLKTILEGSTVPFELVGIAGSSDEAVILLGSGEADLVILDADIGERVLDHVTSIRKARTSARIVVTATRLHSWVRERAARLGVKTFLSKRMWPDDFIRALQLAQAELETNSFEQLTGVDAEGTRLGNSDLMLLNYLAEGLDNDAVARRMHVSVSTLKRQMQRVMEKLEARNRTHAVARAVKRGLI